MDTATTPIYEAFTRHNSSLKRFIGRFMRNNSDVDDIAQEAFLRAYAVELGRPIEQPKSFLFRIAKHLALTQLTRKSRQITEYIEDSDDADSAQVEFSAEEEISGRQMLQVHCDAVETLSPQVRRAYLLRKVHGLSHKEIAKHEGIAVSTVEKHLMKAAEVCERYVRERVEVRRNKARFDLGCGSWHRRAKRSRRIADALTQRGAVPPPTPVTRERSRNTNQPASARYSEPTLSPE